MKHQTREGKPFLSVLRASGPDSSISARYQTQQGASRPHSPGFTPKLMSSPSFFPCMADGVNIQRS